MKETETLGKDLRLRFDDLGADLSVDRKGDLSTINDQDNLAQAIICRLATEEGELFDIGHAEYGSRLYEVIGEVNNELTRQKIARIVQDCLLKEPRVEKVVSVKVISDPENHNKVAIEFTVLPRKNEETPFTIYYPFNLEG
jgi:phage baseplate assembly protein W